HQDRARLAENNRQEDENPGRQPAVPPSAAGRLCWDIGLDRPVRAIAIVGPARSGLLVVRIEISHQLELAHGMGLSITSNGFVALVVTLRSAQVRSTPA